MELSVSRKPNNVWLAAAGGAAIYAAAWAFLSAMAGLSSEGALALAPGLLALALAALLPRRAAVVAGAVSVAAAVALGAALGAVDGAGLFINRLFAASAARQSYEYEMLAAVGGMDELRAALLCAGLLVGSGLGALARTRFRAASAAIPVALMLVAAYLGVSPGWGACLALAAATAFALVDGGAVAKVGFAALAAAVCLAVVAVVPGESAAVSALDETLRDTLARVSVAYGERTAAEPSAEASFEVAVGDFREEESEGELGGEEFEWTRTHTAAVVIIILALLLFLPAIASDRIKRRRRKNRAALESADNRAAVSASFLYAFRWLKLAGLEGANLPFCEMCGEVERVGSAELREKYERVLPLWNEAAYSSHEISGERRAEMDEFLGAVETAVRGRIGRRGRFLADYVYAL